MEGLLQDIEPDYSYYADVYHGTMGEAAFGAALPDALAEVSWALWPGADLAPIEDRVKMAVCSVADAAGNTERRLVSYTAGKVRQEFGGAWFSLTAEAGIRRWLGGTGALKRGRWL